MIIQDFITSCMFGKTPHKYIVLAQWMWVGSRDVPGIAFTEVSRDPPRHCTHCVDRDLALMEALMSHNPLSLLTHTKAGVVYI